MGHGSSTAIARNAAVPLRPCTMPTSRRLISQVSERFRLIGMAFADNLSESSTIKPLNAAKSN
jgi:hypothetical protein